MDNEDDDCRYPCDDNDCCPDYCPVFGIAGTILSRPQTIAKEGSIDIKNLASYGFNLPMNRDKSKFLVKKSGFYAIGYYIEACFEVVDIQKNVSVQIYVDRCNKGLNDLTPTDEYNEWIPGGALSGSCTGAYDNNHRYIWAVRSQYLNKGDWIKLQLANTSDTPVNVKVNLAGFAAIRLMPCNCIPPGGLPAIDLKSASLSSLLFGPYGLDLPINLNPFQSMVGNLLSGPIAAVLPTLLKDSLPDVLQSYLGQEAETYEGEQGECLD
jgi:hypothetical protein